MGGWLNAIGKGALGLVNTGYQAQEYAEKMAKNYMQWHVADLRRAGLNPVLGYSAGAPTPGTVSGINLTGLISNYLGSKATAAQVHLQNQQARQVEAKTREANAEATIAEADALNATQNAASKARELASSADKRFNEASLTGEQYLTQRYLTDVNSSKAAIERYGIPEARAEAEMWRDMGKRGAEARFGAEMAKSPWSAAGGAANAIRGAVSDYLGGQ